MKGDHNYLDIGSSAKTNASLSNSLTTFTTFSYRLGRYHLLTTEMKLKIRYNDSSFFHI